MYRTLRITQILILIFLIATVFMGYSCSSDDPIVPEPEPEALNHAPEISVVMAEVNVWGGKILEVRDSKLIVGEDVVMTWSDDHTRDCEVIISLDGANAFFRLAAIEMVGSTLYGINLKDGLS